ncbi:MAG TPA: hypothetical protein VGS79_04740 [Puia sp.]|nr:hypothetical protein [Puia sp.]
MKENRFLARASMVMSIVASIFSNSTMAQNSKQSDRLPLKTGNEYLDIFMANGDSLITRPKDLGIVNEMGSVGINYEFVGDINGFWAPPYASSDYFIEPRIFGEKVKTDHYTWLPFQTKRVGEIQGVRVRSTTTLIYGMRAGVLSIELRNLSKEKKEIPVEFMANDPYVYQTSLDKIAVWGFGTAKSKTMVTDVVDNKGVERIQGNYAIALGCSLKDAKWEEPTRRFRSMVFLQPGEQREFSLVFSMGEKEEAIEARNAILANPSLYVSKGTDRYIAEVKNLFDKLPRFYSDNKNLEQLYDRSIMVLLLNKFQIPELCLHPYYATGSIKGGCFKNYLWSYGAVRKLMPLLDPESDKEHILQFIRSGGLYHGHSFDPISGEGNGSWYPINQNLIIDLTYNYIKNTGDSAFLNEKVDGETILEHMIRNAVYLEDTTKAVALDDYGPSGDHLELRKENTYNHFMPDLNGLRYNNYERVSKLCEIAGKPQPFFMERAKGLKKLMKEQLWDPRIRWFDYEDDKGNKYPRYTIQIFYLINSGVIDNQIKQGLFSHLNENEFLTRYGFLSMSKKDDQYDQSDIDNGGGGGCSLFPPQIAELLYDDGSTAVADDIMRRISWWGRRLPYFGDSEVATEIDYRQDTPLQCDIGSVALSEEILFGMFGINVDFNGNITVNPVKTSLAKKLQIKGFKVRGKTLDVSVDGDKYEVRTGNKTVTNNLGTATIIKN